MVRTCGWWAADPELLYTWSGDSTCLCHRGTRINFWMLKALIYNNKVSGDRISKQHITVMLSCCNTREHSEVNSPAQPFALETSWGAQQNKKQLGEKSSQAQAAWKLESLCFCVLAHRARGQCLTAGSVGSFFASTCTSWNAKQALDVFQRD